MGYTSSQAKEFINQIAPIIVAEGTKRGYKVFSTVIAQAIIESACATSSLGYKYHNYFGMKCGGAWKGASVNMATKEEYTVGQLTSIRDNFRVYESMEDGVAGYYDFIQATRYSNLKTASDYKTYAQYLKDDGYATSSQYVNTLISTVTKYELTKYDTTDSKNIYYPAFSGDTESIVQALDSIGVISTYDYRIKIAKANGIKDYRGTAIQNTQLLVLLKAGKLKRV